MLLTTLSGAPPAAPLTRAGVTWQRLGPGLAQATKERRPLLLVVPGREPGRFWGHLEKRILGAHIDPRALNVFVRVVAEDSRSDALRRLIGDPGSAGVIALLDFHGRVLARWLDAVPERREFERQLRRVAARVEQSARAFARAEKIIQQGAYALEIGKTSRAVEAVLAVEGMGLPTDSGTMDGLRSLQKRIDEKYDRAVKEAEKLENAGDYAGAIARYEKLMKEFPFPDRKREITRRVGRLWTLIRH